MLKRANAREKTCKTSHAFLYFANHFFPLILDLTPNIFLLNILCVFKQIIGNFEIPHGMREELVKRA